MSWEQMASGISLPFAVELTVPELVPFTIELPSPPAVDDIELAAAYAATHALAGVVTPGMTVAVGAGSRGLSGRVELLRGTISALRSLKAQPFVVPAMGSHGGATADGQRALLTALGITEEAIGAEIRATMETVVVAETVQGMPVHLDAHAAAADGFLPVNRVKPHTSFRGPIESGCTKMAVVGFGNQAGAQMAHSCGPVEMRHRIMHGIDALKATGRLLGGIASIESSAGEVVRVAGLRTDDVGGPLEHELTDLSRKLLPRLPFDEIDVLIIERGGKDISGTTIDPNVTGRFWLPGIPDLARPVVHAIVLLDLTDASGGNALGIGLADFIPAALANKIDFQKTYVNAFTTGPVGLRRARLPMVLPDEQSCILAALAMCGRGPGEPSRVVRIESTSHFTECLVTRSLSKSIVNSPSG